MDPRSEALAPEHTHQVHSTLVSWRIQTISNDEQKLDANVNNIIAVFYVTLHVQVYSKNRISADC